MKLQDIVKKINDYLPIRLVMGQDNVGLIAGNLDDECAKMTIAYELNRESLVELLKKRSNLLVTYHTPLYRSKNAFISSASEPDVFFEAVRAGVNLISVHTALDVPKNGLNFALAAKLGLKNIEFLSPLNGVLFKVVVFVPATHLDEVREAMGNAGAGKIGNYSYCAFTSEGEGSFIPSEKASPFIGRAGYMEKVKEIRIEMTVGKASVYSVVDAMLKVHPYEEPAYDIIPLANKSGEYGFGAIGELSKPVPMTEFLSQVKKILDIDSIRISHKREARVCKVGVCAGSGATYYRDAVRLGADIFITGDVKHHDFREAQSKPTVLVDASHLGTERFATDILFKAMREVFEDQLDIEMSKSKVRNAFTF